ncbi:MAG: hypothetical protein IPL98_18870 [Saprospiraceae bacterium]|nr:hypothetical protein [Saprospiraceae bacterium]
MHGFVMDTCPNKAYAKSRGGYYVVIYSIEESIRLHLTKVYNQIYFDL